MKRISNFSLLMFFILFFQSCCRERNESYGIIISDAGFTYPFCFDLPDTLCIREDSTYRSIFKVISAKSTCSKFSLPSIDFTKQSILVNQKHEELGRSYFHRSVTVDSVNKVVVYSVTTTHCFCPDKCINDVWQNIVIVKKIGYDYRIVYK